MNEEKGKKLAEDVIQHSRNRIYFEIRFLEQAIFRLIPIENEQILFGSDGEFLYYSGNYLLRQYLESPENVCVDYLHTIMHCLYQHPIIATQQNSSYWNLASDIAVMDVMLAFNIEWMNMCILTECVEILHEIRKVVPILSASHIFRYICDIFSNQEYFHGYRLDELESIFKRDDHRCWNYEANKEETSDVKKNSEVEDLNNEKNRMIQRSTSIEEKKLQEIWKEVAENVMFSAKNFQQGEMPNTLTQNLQNLTRDNYDYTDFLKKFAVLTERMKLDMDEFDYSYYLYGLSQFKKIPLIEPLEYKEEYAIKEFVIAVDTSESCSGELVQKFLNKTYSILNQTESFSERVALHIIQCDAQIQDDTRIDSMDKLDDYIKNLILHGFGGTDFRPVFRYVDHIRKKGEISRLGGLLYFTDGYGTFPEKAPDYKTAFVFVNRDDDVMVPPWAMKVYLDEEIGYEH